MERLWMAPTWVIATLAVLGPALAYLGILGPFAGFSLLLLAVLVGLVFGIGLAGAAAYASATGKAWRPRALRGAIVPLGVALLAIGGSRMSGTPMIHDISTDLVERIEFTPDVAASSINKDPEPPVRDAVDGIQRESYPDIQPLSIGLPVDQAFARAQSVAAAQPGWKVTSADPESGRIEATATSRIFHFVDDVVIRVRPDPAGARVDLRSRSRVGQGDMGANAARIRAFSVAFAQAN